MDGSFAAKASDSLDYNDAAEALDAAGTGAAEGMGELFGQPDEFLVTLLGR